MEASIQARKPLFFTKDLTKCPYSGLHQGASRTSECGFMNCTDVPRHRHAAGIWSCARVISCSLAEIRSSIVIDLQGLGTWISSKGVLIYKNRRPGEGFSSICCSHCQ